MSDGKEMTSGEFDTLVQQFVDPDRRGEAGAAARQASRDAAEETSQRQVELTGRVVSGEIIFDTPAPLPVEKNTILVGDIRIILKLRQ